MPPRKAKANLDPPPGQGEGQLPHDLDADQGMPPGLVELAALSPEERMEFVRLKQAEARARQLEESVDTSAVATQQHQPVSAPAPENAQDQQRQRRGKA